MLRTQGQATGVDHASHPATASNCLTRHCASRRRASSRGKTRTCRDRITVRHGAYGFAEGSDIGPKGEWEIESITVAGFGALDSSLNVDTAASIKYSVTNDLRLSVGPLAEYHSFRHALDLGNHSGMNFSGSTLFRITQDKISDVGAPDEWFAVARTARKETPDALQGFHASASHRR